MCCYVCQLQMLSIAKCICRLRNLLTFLFICKRCFVSPASTIYIFYSFSQQIALLHNFMHVTCSEKYRRLLTNCFCVYDYFQLRTKLNRMDKKVTINQRPNLNLPPPSANVPTPAVTSTVVKSEPNQVS